MKLLGLNFYFLLIITILSQRKCESYDLTLSDNSKLGLSAFIINFASNVFLEKKDMSRSNKFFKSLIPYLSAMYCLSKFGNSEKKLESISLAALCSIAGMIVPCPNFYNLSDYWQESDDQNEEIHSEEA
jgi:hypothetical protein